ncbi:MAG: hypothetical protein IIY55_08915, partial [Blautia sp.]|nr:hypothetical protein [Blautia sp.]
MKKRFSRWMKAIAFSVTLALALPAAVMLTSVEVSALAESYTVQVSKGYLALRSAKAYDSANELGALVSGDTVVVTDKSDSTYWYCYSTKHGKYGYVNKNYLVPTPS